MLGRGFPLGRSVPQGDVWRQFWLPQVEGLLMVCCRQRPGVLPSILKHTGQPPAVGNYRTPKVISAPAENLSWMEINLRSSY